MLEYIYEPWAWYVAGPIITAVMLSLMYVGKSFGVSANLRTLCTICGAGKVNHFFAFDWKKQAWNLVFVLGMIIGGCLAHLYMVKDEMIALNPKTIEALQALNFTQVGNSYLPDEIFGMQALHSLKGWLILIVGGFLIGFGTRYAGGCTSGHAISGLSNLQPASLIAVIGFFIGGLLMSYVLFPYIF